MEDFDLIPCLPLELAFNCLLRVPLQYHGKLKQVCRPWKALLESPHFYPARQQSGFSEKYSCFIQTMQEAPPRSSHLKAPLLGVTVYSSKQKAWERLPPIEGLPHGLPLFCQCAAVGTRLVLMGGWDPLTWEVLKSVHIYDFLSRRWRRGADMKTARSFFGCASLQERRKVLVMGGHDDSKNALRTAELYDLERDEWVEVAEMGEERDECKAVGTDANKALVLSGYGTEAQGQFTRSVESFDFESGVWKREEGMEIPRCAPSCTCVVAHEGRLYALAGGRLLVMEEVGWEEVAVVPAQVSVASIAASSEGGILVHGFGGASSPYEAFLCRLSGGTSPTWHKVNFPDTFARLVQVACTIEA